MFSPFLVLVRGVFYALRLQSAYHSVEFSFPHFFEPFSISEPFHKRGADGIVSFDGKIANRIERETGKRASAQAVDGAAGHNSVSLVIPCHRVVGANGSLTGYAGGTDKKIALLKMEGAYTSEPTLPKKGTAL